MRAAFEAQRSAQQEGQSALSRVVGRLEDDGLVTGAICSNDRRGM
jgi:DNA-binding MarR family transcriptional regulator